MSTGSAEADASALAADRLFAGPGEVRAICRALDWGVTALGSVEHWPQSLKTAADICLSSLEPASIFWGARRIQLYNDAFLPIAAERHPVILGRAAAENWGDGWSVIGPLLEGVLADGKPRSAKHLPVRLHRDGVAEERLFSFSLSAIRDEQGEFAGAFLRVNETTAEVRADGHVPFDCELHYTRLNAARQSEAKFRALLTSSAQSLFRMSADWSTVLQMQGDFYAPLELQRQPWAWLQDYVHPEDQQRVRQAAKKAAQAGDVFESEHRVRRADGSWGWTFCRAISVRSDEGRRTEWLGTSTDTTERKQGEQAIRQMAERNSFRIALSDALRPLVDPAQIQAEATRVLGRHLGASRVHYGGVTGDVVQVHDDYCNGVPSIAGVHRLSSYSKSAQELMSAGNTFVTSDVFADPRFDARERASLSSIGVAAFMAVPLVKGGALTGILVAHQVEPRDWKAEEVMILEETAERTWAAVERALAETALRESEARYRSLFTSIDEGFMLAELVRDASGLPVDYRFLEVNPAFEKLTGMTRAAMTGRTARELVPHIAPYWLETYAHLVETGEPMRFERFEPSRGRWYAVVTFARGGDQFAALFDDISSRKWAEQALRASESRFRTLVQNVRDYAIFMIDPGGTITEWTEGAERVTGYTAAEAIGQHVSLFYLKEDVSSGEALRELAEATRRGRAEREAWRVRKGGERFWANEIATAIHDTSGTLLGFTKVSRDLSERKQMQDALRDVEQRHRLIVESARDFAIFMTDPQGRITTWNPGATHIFGYSALEIIGRSAAALFTPEAVTLGTFERELATAAAEGRASDDGWHLNKDGTRFWASGVMASMRDADGRLQGFVKVLRDRTEAKLVEEERERLLEREQAARREAEAAMRMRDEFVAVVSHELRTPLSAILIWARMLRAGAIKPQDQAQALATIEQSATAQRQLIDDLLDASRMLSGKVQLSVREVELAPLVESAIEVVRPMSEAKGVLVTAELDASVPRARVDPDRLQQVLWNLLHNAMKFTPQGGRVCVRLVGLERAVRLEVEDTGRGISTEFLPQVFDRFRQADASITREHGGLGLGLSITRQLVELHGGTIRATSAGEGHGATFTVELPLLDLGARPGGDTMSALGGGAKTPPFVPSPLLTGIRVLIVEDETHTRTVLQWLLEQCDAEVTAIGSAEEGLATLEGGARFDVLVSDVGLPGHDGYALLRQVREHFAGSKLPALALTAYARDEDRSRAEEAGFEAYLSKPVEPRALVEAIAVLARR